MPSKTLSTTSYAILGWLSLRAFSTYEIAQLMRRGMRFFWPRAESQLYEEPKNLVAHGLATARRTRSGRRPRTVYTITAKGRRALRQWQAMPANGPLLEFDALVHVFFGLSATPQQLAAAAQAAIAAADEIQTRGREVAREYLEGRAPQPEREHLSGLVFDFLWDHAANLRRWGEATRAEVAGWRHCDADSRKIARARRVFRDALDGRRPA